MSRASLAILSLLGGAMPAAAQPPDTSHVIARGTRVRVTHSCTFRHFARGPVHVCERDTGAIEALRDGSLILDPDGAAAVLAVPVLVTSRVEVSLGRLLYGRGRGGVLGLLAGLGGGWAMGALAEMVACPASNCGGRVVTAGVLAGGATGLVLGARAGATPRDRWEAVPVNQLEIVGRPLERVVAVGARLRW